MKVVSFLLNVSPFIVLSKFSCRGSENHLYRNENVPHHVVHSLNFRASPDQNTMSNDDSGIPITPEIVMEFLSEKDAYNFYNMYAWKMGFSIRRSNAHKDMSDHILDQIFCCSKQGKCPTNKKDTIVDTPCAISRCGYMSEINVSRRFNERFRVVRLITNHVHDFNPPEITHMLRSQ